MNRLKWPRNKKFQGGFTLIELMISMGLGSFGAIAAVRLMSNMELRAKFVEDQMDFKIDNVQLSNFLKTQFDRSGGILNREPAYDESLAFSAANYRTTAVVFGNPTRPNEQVRFRNTCEVVNTAVAPWTRIKNLVVPNNIVDITTNPETNAFRHCAPACAAGSRPIIQVERRGFYNTTSGTFSVIAGADFNLGQPPKITNIPDRFETSTVGGMVCAFPIYREESVIWAITFALARTQGTNQDPSMVGKWDVRTHYFHAKNCPGLKDPNSNTYVNLMPQCS
jgi:prepilin-type N-terminal cleavage/methylation domain-containing protein